MSNIRHDIGLLPYPANVFALWVDLDNWENLIPNVPYGTSEIHVSFLCSDLFEWGTADSEYISPEDFPLLFETATELEDMDETFYVAELFCARKRKMRPQGPWFTQTFDNEITVLRSSPELRELFEKAGPKRESTIFNPGGS